MQLADALKNLTHEEAEAIRQALDQYVENNTADALSDDPYEDDPMLVHAEAVLDRLNGFYASLAEDSSRS